MAAKMDSREKKGIRNSKMHRPLECFCRSQSQSLKECFISFIFSPNTTRINFCFALSKLRHFFPISLSLPGEIQTKKRSTTKQRKVYITRLTLTNIAQSFYTFLNPNPPHFCRTFRSVHRAHRNEFSSLV